MEEKYKQLHLLIDKVSARLSEAEQENLVLKAKMRTLESSLRIAQSGEAAAKALKEWKDVTMSILKKLYAKTEKEIERIEAQSRAPQTGDK